MAMVVTNLAASVGGLTWMFMDWRLERKWSAIGFCSGAVCGLVGITPASGYVGAPASVAIGFVTAAVCNLSTRIKFLLRIDDALDVFATHGIGGMVGCLMTGLFAQASVAGLDGTEIPGGWLDHHYIQLAYQVRLTLICVWNLLLTDYLLFSSPTAHQPWPTHSLSPRSYAGCSTSFRSCD